jgi:carbonic anhydrase/acetyltransferase-like protein (isoleucine patch superfamily)
VIVSLALATGVALAADPTCDLGYDLVDGACVHQTATVDPLATVGRGARVGPGVALGAGVMVAPRAVLDGASAEATPQGVGASTALGRRAHIGPDAVLGADNAFARAVVAGQSLSTVDDVIVGYAAVIGDHVTLGTGAQLGNLAQVGDHATVGAGARVGREATIADGSSALDGAEVLGNVGPGADIAAGATIALGASVRRGATVGAGATVETGAVVGRGATVAPGATLASGGALRAGATLCDGTTHDGTVPRSGTWPEVGCALVGDPTRPAASCADVRDNRPGALNGPYTIDLAADAVGPFTAYCDVENDGGGWMLAVNIDTDLGAVDLFTYTQANPAFTVGNYGLGLAGRGLTTATEYRLTCVETSGGAYRELFLRGLNPAEPIFQAAGTIDKTALECATTHDFASPVLGAACLSRDDTQHTYYGYAAADINWALYSVGPAYTLRHCRPTGIGYHNKGALWVR